MEASGHRPSGIDVIGAVPWGTHFCQFYETDADLVDVLVPYFKAGLAGNEYCMWVTSDPLQAPDAEAALRRAVPELDDYLDAGAIEILPYTSWYVEDGVFDADRVLAGWVQRLARATELGFDGLRLTGNTFWLEAKDWDGFTSYEEAINDVIGSYRMIALCTYSLHRCGAAELIDVIRNHQFALVKEEGTWVQIESSERKRAQAEIERLSRDVEERSRLLAAANEELEAFNYSVSHDLRAPLRAIEGFAAALAEDNAADLDPRGREHLGRIRTAALRMDELLDDLLRLSRLMRVDLRASRIDLAAVAREIAGELAEREPGRAVRFIAPENAPATGDPGLIRAALENLLGNAWKFTRLREDATVEFGVERVGAETVFFVRDNGVGFDPRYASLLFTPFRRLHGAEDFTGNGLGLATVRRIVARHGGAVSAEGSPGAGATIRFTLEAPSPASTAAVAAPRTPLRSGMPARAPERTASTTARRRHRGAS